MHRGQLRHVALAGFLASLALPTFDAMPGVLVLLQGAAAIFVLCPAWVANPLFVLAYALYPRKPFDSGIMAGAAVGFGACTFYFSGMPGNPELGKHWGPGVYVWLSSLALLAVATWPSPTLLREHLEGRSSSGAP